MVARTIRLVEDNKDDEELTLRALARNNIGNHVVVVRDGQEAIDWLEGVGSHAGRNPADVPALMLLDLKLPKLDGLEVLQRRREFVRAEAGRLQPVCGCSAPARDLLADVERAAA